MNDELEEKLRMLHLAAPSVELDRRMDELFAARSRGHRGWWLAALAAAGMAAVVMVLLSPPPAPPPPVVCRVEAQGPMRAWLLTPPRKSLPPPTMIVTVGP